MDYDPPPPYYEPSTQPGLEEEKNDVYYDSQNTMMTKSAKAKRSTFATVLSMFIVIPYFGLLICGLVSLGLFASKDNDIHKINPDESYNGFCILYSTYRSDQSPKFQLSRGQSCKFFIYGQAFVSFLALVMIILSVIKIVWGRWLSCVLIFDFVVLVLGMIFSVATSITVSIGLSITCSSFKDWIGSQNSDCSLYYFTKRDDSDVQIYFQSVIYQSELAAWTGFGGVFLMFLIELVISLMACLIKRKKDTSSSYNTLNELKDPVAI